MDKDYYKILGVEKKATKSEIKKAFHKLAHKYHPDKSGGDEAKFKEANEAYTVLSNDKKRAEYDTYGQSFSSGGFDSSGFQNGFGGFEQGGMEFDLGDLFGDFFGGGRHHKKRGSDISVDIEISFAEAVFGIDRKIVLIKNSVCDECQGTGSKAGSAMENCSACGGNGKIHETKQSFFGAFSTVKVCEKCNGRGQISKEKCKKCKGSGVVKQKEEFNIKIPAGINNGEMIRLAGAGEAISGGVPGDLYVKIYVKTHPVFKKQGSDLIMDLEVKLSDALLGAEYKIDTLEGKLKLKIPKGMKHGEVLRLKDKGVPIGDKKRGSLLIVLRVKLPNKLSSKAKKLVEELKEEGV